MLRNIVSYSQSSYAERIAQNSASFAGKLGAAQFQRELKTELEKKSDPSKASGDAVEVSIGDRSKANDLKRAESYVELFKEQRARKKEEDKEKKKEDEKEIRELEARDREVRQHEQAHKAKLGANAAGPINYEYDRGPNGKQYAIAGSVAVDLSEEKSPEETERKMKVVRQAALAPAEPSGPDRQVAAQAAAKEAEARSEAQAEKAEEKKEREAKRKEKDEKTPPGVAAYAASSQAYQTQSSFSFTA